MKIKAVRDLSEYELNLQELVKRAYASDACIDLITCEPIVLKSFTHNPALVPSGVAVEIPVGHFGQILARSGLAKTQGLEVMGGIIDSGYRGEIMINLINLGQRTISFAVGDRVAQLIVLPYLHVDLTWVDELSNSDRGENGHGSTGR